MFRQTYFFTTWHYQFTARHIPYLFIDTSNNKHSVLWKKNTLGKRKCHQRAPAQPSKAPPNPKTRQVINNPETIDSSHKNPYLTSKLLQVSFSNKPPLRQMSAQQKQQQIIHQIKEFSKQTQNTKAFDTSIRWLKKGVTDFTPKLDFMSIFWGVISSWRRQPLIPR